MPRKMQGNGETPLQRQNKVEEWTMSQQNRDLTKEDEGGRLGSTVCVQVGPTQVDTSWVLKRRGSGAAANFGISLDWGLVQELSLPSFALIVLSSMDTDLNVIVLVYSYRFIEQHAHLVIWGGASL